MNGTDTDEITAYVEAVRDALAGLPEATRSELLEDLPEHLAEVAADGVGPLIERLGPPSVYAAELLASAGFVGGFPDPPPTTDRLAELREITLQRFRVADAKIGPLFGYEHASEFLNLLRPAWWVLRGYLVAMVVAWMLDDSGQPIGLLPRIGGSEVVALLLLAAAVLGSVWFGRRSPRLAKGPRYALYAGSAVLVLMALGGFLSADRTSRGSFYSDVADFENPYGHVRDLFVYDEQGRLIEGARLFDQDGQPIRMGDPYCKQDSYGRPMPAPDDSRYPYCPENAPFRMPFAPDAVPAAPTRTDPMPSESASPSSSTPVRPSASAGTTAGASATPTPSR